MKNENDVLKEAIMTLEGQSEVAFKALQEQFSNSIEMLKPINLIKSTLKEVTTSREINDSMVNGLAGMTAGYLTRKLVVGGSKDHLRQMFGSMVQFATARIVSKYVGGHRKSQQISK